MGIRSTNVESIGVHRLNDADMIAAIEKLHEEKDKNYDAIFYREFIKRLWLKCRLILLTRLFPFDSQLSTSLDVGSKRI